MFKQIFLGLFLVAFSICSAQENRTDSDGNRHGYWKVNFEGTSHTKFEGLYDHGKQIGEFKYYKKGQYRHPSAIMNFSESDTVSINYFTQTGNIISTGKLLNRERTGKWTYYHKDSDSIMMTEVYKNDSLNGLQQTYFTNGEIAEKTNYRNGEKNGNSKIYSKNGQVVKDLNYLNGQLHGKAKYYSLKGELIMEGTYHEGQKTEDWKNYKEMKVESNTGNTDQSKN